jgi:hypothetical protein
MLRPTEVTIGVMTRVRMTESASMVATRPISSVWRGVCRKTSQEQQRSEPDLEQAVAPEERAIDFRRHVANHHARGGLTQGFGDFHELRLLALHDPLDGGKASCRRKPHAQRGHDPRAQNCHGQHLRSCHRSPSEIRHAVERRSPTRGSADLVRQCGGELASTAPARISLRPHYRRRPLAPPRLCGERR